MKQGEAVGFSSLKQCLSIALSIWTCTYAKKGSTPKHSSSSPCLQVSTALALGAHPSFWNPVGLRMNSVESCFILKQTEERVGRDQDPCRDTMLFEVLIHKSEALMRLANKLNLKEEKPAAC